jgi:hypothetical protein
MMVDITVRNEEEFKKAEMELFGRKFQEYMEFTIFVESTGDTWFYETQYLPQFEAWLVATK